MFWHSLSRLAFTIGYTAPTISSGTAPFHPSLKTHTNTDETKAASVSVFNAEHKQALKLAYDDQSLKTTTRLDPDSPLPRRILRIQSIVYLFGLELCNNTFSVQIYVVSSQAFLFIYLFFLPETFISSDICHGHLT